MTDFTVEAVAGQKLSVSWETETHHLHFQAPIDGDKMGAISGKYPGSKYPVIYKRRLEGGRGALTHGSPEKEPFASIVAEARQKIDGAAIRAAIQERADRLAETERQRVAAKAKAMREAIGTIVDLLGAQDDELAKAYDEIQNSCA